MKINLSAIKRTPNNPILRPNPTNRWESFAVFNTAALYLDERVHLIYRAIGESGLSVLGYASSKDGIHIDQRLAEPVFVSDNPLLSAQKMFDQFQYLSGGSGWGCEDPRLVTIGETIYMTYTAFDGCHPPGIALTSIKVSDFLNKKWDWKKPILISPAQEMHKNWVIFPEKINGKYAILHSITPHVSIAYVEELDFESDPNIDSYYRPGGREGHWDDWIRGVGPPPIKTKEGWLVLYHAMDSHDPNKYKIGAYILDLEEPTKILYRLDHPLLEPETDYENVGHKTGVIYSCGTVLIREKLFIYYGGADTVICAAIADLDMLLQQIKIS